MMYKKHQTLLFINTKDEEFKSDDLRGKEMSDL